MSGTPGQIEIFPFPTWRQGPLPGWARCRGQNLSPTLFPELYEAIGFQYGRGELLFLLPDLPPLTPVGPYYYICTGGRLPLD